MMAKRGQMRVIEALIACSLIFIAHNLVSSSSSFITTRRGSELESLGENLLNILENQDLLMDLRDNKEVGVSSVREIVESLLPPDMLYNISIKSLEFDEVLVKEITNISPDADISKFDKTMTQGVYAYTFPTLQKKDVLLDLMLLIDRSQSMGHKITGDEEDKIQYAKEASCSLINKMDNRTDRVGLVAFSTHQNIRRDLTYDYDHIKHKITHLAVGGMTNITKGIYEANERFGAAREDASKFIILLTDGREPTRWAVINQADIAKENGIRIYTIGLGDDVDEELLEEIKTEGYFYAASGRDLENIYDVIAMDLIYMVKYDLVLIQITLINP